MRQDALIEAAFRDQEQRIIAATPNEIAKHSAIAGKKRRIHRWAKVRLLRRDGSNNFAAQSMQALQKEGQPMKATIKRADGTTINAEGTAEEIAHLADKTTVAPHVCAPCPFQHWPSVLPYIQPAQPVMPLPFGWGITCSAPEGAFPHNAAAGTYHIDTKFESVDAGTFVGILESAGGIASASSGKPV